MAGLDEVLERLVGDQTFKEHLARDLARELAGESEVSGEMLLLALLRTDDSLRRDLEVMGLHMAGLEDELNASRVPPLQVDEPLNLDEPVERLDLARVLDASANRARDRSARPRRSGRRTCASARTCTR